MIYLYAKNNISNQSFSRKILIAHFTNPKEFVSLIALMFISRNQIINFSFVFWWVYIYLSGLNIQ